jgi:hypothetical protein
MAGEDIRKANPWLPLYGVGYCRGYSIVQSVAPRINHRSKPEIYSGFLEDFRTP